MNLLEIVDVLTIGTSALVKNPCTRLVDFCLPTFTISSEVTPMLIINCRSQGTNMFFFNKASGTGTTAKISSSRNKNPFVVQGLAVKKKML